MPTIEASGGKSRNDVVKMRTIGRAIAGPGVPDLDRRTDVASGLADLGSRVPDGGPAEHQREPLVDLLDGHLLERLEAEPLVERGVDRGLGLEVDGHAVAVRAQEAMPDELRPEPPPLVRRIGPERHQVPVRLRHQLLPSPIEPAEDRHHPAAVPERDRGHQAHRGEARPQRRPEPDVAAGGEPQRDGLEPRGPLGTPVRRGGQPHDPVEHLRQPGAADLIDGHEGNPLRIVHEGPAEHPARAGVLPRGDEGHRGERRGFSRHGTILGRRRPRQGISRHRGRRPARGPALRAGRSPRASGGGSARCRPR